jgi:hypothetical protein
MIMMNVSCFHSLVGRLFSGRKTIWCYFRLRVSVYELRSSVNCSANPTHAAAILHTVLLPVWGWLTLQILLYSSINTVRTFPGSGSPPQLGKLIARSYGSGIYKTLARHGWSLYVSQFGRVSPSYNNSLLGATLHPQLGVLHYSWLRVVCNPRPSPIPVDDLGLYWQVLLGA